MPGLTFLHLWDVLEERRWRINCEDVQRYICGADAPNALCLINLDEVNVLFPDGSARSSDSPTSAFLSSSLSSLLHLQRHGLGCVVPVLTATKALVLPGVVLASGARYRSIPLPLLADEFVQELALDLQHRAARACQQAPAESVPAAVRHLLALMAGNPRFLELLLFRLGRMDGLADLWSPQTFVRTWAALAQADASDAPSLLDAVLQSALQRYSRFDTYLCTEACAAIVPELLYFSLFERPLERTDSIGGCPVRELEESGVVFLSPVVSGAHSSSRSFSPPQLRLVLPFLWLHRIAQAFEHGHSNFVRVPLLSSLQSYLSPDGFESLAANVLALRCYFHAKQGRPGADGHVRVSTDELLGVRAMDGSATTVRLPPLDGTRWRVLQLHRRVEGSAGNDTWTSFQQDPAAFLEPAQAAGAELAPRFFLNGPQASFWDSCALLDPPVFVQSKRSQRSLRREASGDASSTFTWPSALAEIRKCQVELLRPVFLLCSDEVIARPAASISTTHTRSKAKSAPADSDDFQSRTFLVDAANHRCFFGSLLSTRKAMSFAHEG